MGTYRLVVCIDVDASSLEEAYGKVYQTMDATGVAWESSDEAFGPDGELIDEPELSRARMHYLAAKGDGENSCPHGKPYVGESACSQCGR